jgi:hypothetical protein
MYNPGGKTITRTSGYGVHGFVAATRGDVVDVVRDMHMHHRPMPNHKQEALVAIS